MRHVKNKRMSVKKKTISYINGKMESTWFSWTQTSVVIVADIFHVVRGALGEEARVGAGRAW